jgi:pyrroline-5-carboxylate reductase
MRVRIVPVGLSSYRIGFIGFGHMAKIICRCIEFARLIPRSQIIFSQRDPDKIRSNEQELRITAATLETLVSQSDLILLCVRPPQAKEILQALAKWEWKDKVLISILAGVKISYFSKFLGSCPVVRAMPNIASAVGEGMTILTPNSYVSPELRSAVNLLFTSMGNTVQLDEQLMDIATGMAGSGPAFVFSLIEAVARLGEKEGIVYEQSLTIAAQTFLGAARILLKGDVPVRELLRHIAVPNGTTEAGLKVMKDLGIEMRFQDVIIATAARSKAISEEI